MSIVIGGRYRFNNHTRDSSVARFDKQAVTVLRQLGPDEADPEVGPVYRVRAAGQPEFDALGDELDIRLG